MVQGHLAGQVEVVEEAFKILQHQTMDLDLEHRDKVIPEDLVSPILQQLEVEGEVILKLDQEALEALLKVEMVLI
jgi:hypothetical protein